ncbi:hypothetical protein VSP15_12985, partial [Escherichia coli]|nr:hypothetical protein [Escherichia coli]
SAQIREILISESTWEEMTCLFAPSLGKYLYHHDKYVIYLEVTNHQHFLPFFPSPGHTDIFPRTKDSA